MNAIDPVRILSSGSGTLLTGIQVPVFSVHMGSAEGRGMTVKLGTVPA